MGANEQGTTETQGRWLTIPRTLCFVTYGDEILLMKRAAHKRIFPNQYNGVGGHIEPHEDPLSGALREIKEETGLEVYNIRLRAVYNVNAGGENGIILFVFTAVSRSKVICTDTDEGTLHWVKQSDLRTLDLVEDLPCILPRVLAAKEGDLPLFIHVSYDKNDLIQMRFAHYERTS